MRNNLLFTAALGLLVVVASCGGPPKGPDLSRCELVAGPDAQGDTITVALLEAVDSQNAPAATNDGERQVFRVAYETLINIDCTGGIYTGLATRWHKKDGGRRWEFELREGAEFHDGSPVRASDVADSWRRAASRFPGAHAAVESVGVDGPGKVNVYLVHKRDDVPRIFAGTQFAASSPALSSPSQKRRRPGGPSARGHTRFSPGVRPAGTSPFPPARPGGPCFASSSPRTTPAISSPALST
jgi:ABC-type transport system substrate-binding protein